MANQWKIDRTQARVLTLYIQDGDLNADEDDIGNFLLLLRALTYEPDATTREGVLAAVERPASPAAHTMKQARRLADEGNAIRGRVHAVVSPPVIRKMLHLKLPFYNQD
jgi:hypothetical protein